MCPGAHVRARSGLFDSPDKKCRFIHTPYPVILLEYKHPAIETDESLLVIIIMYYQIQYVLIRESPWMRKTLSPNLIPIGLYRPA